MPAAEDPNLVRLEGKVDSLTALVSDLKSSNDRLLEQVTADRRLAEQYNSFTQQTITRQQGELDELRAELKHSIDEIRLTARTDLEKEIKDRKEEDLTTRGTLKAVGMALFTVLLATAGSGLLYALTH